MKAIHLVGISIGALAFSICAYIGDADFHELTRTDSSHMSGGSMYCWLLNPTACSTIVLDANHCDGQVCTLQKGINFFCDKPKNAVYSWPQTVYDAYPAEEAEPYSGYTDKEPADFLCGLEWLCDTTNNCMFNNAIKDFACPISQTIVKEYRHIGDSLFGDECPPEGK